MDFAAILAKIPFLAFSRFFYYRLLRACGVAIVGRILGFGPKCLGKVSRSKVKVITLFIGEPSRTDIAAECHIGYVYLNVSTSHARSVCKIRHYGKS